MTSRTRDGFVMMWCIIALTAMFGMLLLTVNWGRLVITATQLQNTADASALAGAALVRTDGEEAKDKAISIAAQNKVLGSQLHIRKTPDVVTGYFRFSDRVFHTNPPTNSNDLTDVPAVHVIAPRTQGSLDGTIPMLLMETYGELIGKKDVVTKAEIWRQAIAVSGSTKAAPGVLSLSPDEDCALEIKSKDISVVVHNGDIQVNSDSSSAISFSGGKSEIQADNVKVNGTVDFRGNSGCVTGDLEEHAETMPDPLAYLPPPAKPADGVLIGKSTYKPGYYPNAKGEIISNKKGNIVLEPGIYYLDCPLDFSGQGSVVGTGVLIYLSANAISGKLPGVDMSGQANITLTPMTSGLYKNICIYQDRSNDTVCDLTGQGNLRVGGVVYAPSAKVDLTGNSGLKSFGTIIANTYRVTGNGVIDVDPLSRPIPENLNVYLVQ